jgi:hypothetical protein
MLDPEPILDRRRYQADHVHLRRRAVPRVVSVGAAAVGGGVSTTNARVTASSSTTRSVCVSGESIALEEARRGEPHYGRGTPWEAEAHVVTRLYRCHRVVGRVNDSTSSEPPRPLAVTVGGRSEVVGAIKRRLRSRFDVRELVQGDDVTAEIREAQVVIVLEAASVRADVTKYRHALAAVAEGLRDSKVRSVIAVSTIPAPLFRRARLCKGLEEAERSFRTAGVPLLALHCASLIGTPDDPGPSDPYVVAPEDGRLSVRGDGDQSWTPVRLDDVARLVAAAADRREVDQTCELGGPTTTTVLGLLQAINGQEVKVRKLGRLPWGLTGARDHIPNADLALRGSDVVARTLGVQMEPVESAWDSAAVERYRSRAQSRAGAFAYRIRPSSPVIAHFLGLLAIASAWVGIHDFFLWGDLSVSLTGLTLLAAGIVMGVGSLALFRPWRIRYVLAFLGSLTAAFVMLALVLTNFTNGGPGEVAALAAVGLAGAVASAGSLWRVGGLAVAKLFARGLPATLTSVIGVGTVVGFGQFWYQNVYRPSVHQPVVNLSADLSAGETRSLGRRVIYGTVTLTNPTEREITILASHYALLGARVRERTKGRPDFKKTIAERDRPLGTNLRVTDKKVLRSGEVLGTGSFLGPDETIRKRVAVAVPKGLDLATLDAFLVMARERLSPRRLTPIAAVRDLEKRAIYQGVDIDEESLWRQLTRGDRFLYTMETVGNGDVGYFCQGFPQVQAYIDGADRYPEALADDKCTEHSKRLAEYYRITSTNANTELLLPPPAGPADNGRKRPESPSRDPGYSRNARKRSG